MEHILFFIRQVLQSFGKEAVDNFDATMEEQLLHFVLTNRKIEAIKLLRTLTLPKAPIVCPYTCDGKPIPSYIQDAIACTNDASKRGEFGGRPGIMSLYDAKLVIDTVYQSVHGNIHGAPQDQ